MAWVTPKVNWNSETDCINYDDYNRIKNNAFYIYGTAISQGYLPILPPPHSAYLADKAVNDLWYADEVNQILEDIDHTAEALGLDFYNKPFYAPNGATPTAFELNVIERTEKRIYDYLYKSYVLYAGQGGYSGSRVTNMLL